jgi:MarR family transcriptional regulator, multiple antibiotic resistance protein MarR
MGFSERVAQGAGEGGPATEEEPVYSEASYRIEESVGYLLAQLRARQVSAVDAESAAYDITAAQWSTLLYIGNGHGRTAAELCRRTSCDTGSMTRMLDRLEEKGLIRRCRSTEDRRVANIEFTAAGAELFPKLPSIAIRVLNRHLRGFTRDEVDQLKSFLRRMLANADT